MLAVYGIQKRVDDLFSYPAKLISLIASLKTKSFWAILMISSHSLPARFYRNKLRVTGLDVASGVALTLVVGEHTVGETTRYHGMTFSASIKQNFLMSNMYLDCGLDSRVV